MPNRFRLIVRWSIRVAALGTEHLPEPLVLQVGDPAPIRIVAPAKTKPTCVREMVVLVWVRLINGCSGFNCAVANPEREIAPYTHVVKDRPPLGDDLVLTCPVRCSPARRTWAPSLKCISLNRSTSEP